jgi:hypothetical protein
LAVAVLVAMTAAAVAVQVAFYTQALTQSRLAWHTRLLWELVQVVPLLAMLLAAQAVATTPFLQI